MRVSPPQLGLTPVRTLLKSHSNMLPQVNPRNSESAAAWSSPAEASVIAASREEGENRANLGSHEERHGGHGVERGSSSGRRLTSGQPGEDTLNSAGAVEEGFRMPETVESGIGGTWDDGPFGPIGMCPSSPKVFEIGIAVDTGFFKVGPLSRPPPLKKINYICQK